jgi:replication factor C subunit 2/4
MSLFFRSREQKEFYSLWTDVYAPKSLDEVVGNSDLVKILQQYILIGNIPNILLTGPHGTCKKTLVNLLLSEHFGTDIKDFTLTIDGAVERGKEFVSASEGDSSFNIINFCKLVKKIPDGKKRVVFINNFDKMTTEAQNALRRVIEIYTNTVFILICDDSNNTGRPEDVIEAIQSRCVPFHTSPLTDDEIGCVLERILERRRAPVEAEQIESIAMLSGGDVRKAISFLQLLSGAGPNWRELINIPSSEKIREIIKLGISTEGKFEAFRRLNRLHRQGYSVSEILYFILNVLIRYTELPIKERMSRLQKIAQTFNSISDAEVYGDIYRIFI